MRVPAVVRPLLAAALLIALPGVPTIGCATSGNMAHVCCSERCTCAGHGGRSSSHTGHAGHGERSHGATEHAKAAAAHDAHGTHGVPGTHSESRAAHAEPDTPGASCSLSPESGGPLPEPSPGVNFSTLRPATFARTAPLPLPSAVGRSNDSSEPRPEAVIGEVRTPPPRAA